ncbi:MAG: serine hydrolase [Candidatus Paceibacterota bacterium]
MHGHSFDTNGFFFILKALLVLVVIGLGVHMVNAYPFSSDTQASVHEENIEEKETSIHPEIEIETSPPPIPAAGYLVGNLETGEVYAKRNADVVRPIASISKLMTAVVANETIGYNTLVYVSNAAVRTYGNQGGLYEGQRMSLHTMFHPLLLSSSNDAGEAIAGHLGQTRFYDLMNRKAIALKMKDTHFSDSSGLSDRNTSTPNDLFELAKYIYNQKKYIFDITTLPSATLLIEGTGLKQSFYNNNPFAGAAGFIGGKNGYTDNARKTLLSVFEMELAGRTYPIVIIVLGSEDHVSDTETLHSWFQEETL